MVCEADERKDREYDETQTSQGFRKSLVVPGQPAESVELAEAAPLHPATRQQYEALFRLRRPDHLKLDAFIAGGLCRLFAGVALVSERDSHSLLRGLLELSRQIPDLCPLLFVGRRHTHSKQLRQWVHRHVHLAAFFPLVPV